jgi:hypothetical protein
MPSRAIGLVVCAPREKPNTTGVVRRCTGTSTSPIPWELLRKRPVIRACWTKENTCRDDIEGRDGKDDRDRSGNSDQKNQFQKPITAEHFHSATDSESLSSSE